MNNVPIHLLNPVDNMKGFYHKVQTVKLVLVIINLFDGEINLPFGLERNLVLERSTIFFGINFFLFCFPVDIFFVA